MAKKINMDAMIPRADFCELEEKSPQTDKIPALGLSQLGEDSFLVPNLRKPDFQRETNQWSIDQVLVFLKSFLDNELVPSVILWQSPSSIFVIDGAHRLSALIAWIRDDYGDGTISQKFYGPQISGDQSTIADRLRKRINREIGSFTQFKQAMKSIDNIESDRVLSQRASNAITRTLSLQWVEGNAEKAESSFFKINTQGTPLDKVEGRLLKNRRKPIAIAARSVVRAGYGHKYWSNFQEDIQSEIEKISRELHGLLFSPEIERPIRTLNLPHGGHVSTISACNIMMNLFAYAIEQTDRAVRDSYLYSEDVDGAATIRVLKGLRRVMFRITGNESPSLGLHPAVYFYSATGRHWDVVLVATVSVFSKAIKNNDDAFFRSFTENRRTLEEIFLNHKTLIGQANIAIRSTNRVQKWSELIERTARGKLFAQGVSADEILGALDLRGKVVASDIREVGANFSRSTKSAVFLKDSVKAALKCPLCGGLFLAEKSVSYDHVKPKTKGGTGSPDNVQLTHPYCNSIKGAEIV